MRQANVKGKIFEIYVPDAAMSETLKRRMLSLFYPSTGSDTEAVWRKIQAHMKNLQPIYRQRKAQERAIRREAGSPLYNVHEPPNETLLNILSITRDVIRHPPLLCPVTVLREWDWVLWQNCDVKNNDAWYWEGTQVALSSVYDTEEGLAPCPSQDLEKF